MTKDFLVNILSVPSCSGHEGFLAECIESWCRTAGVKCRKDGSGNMFLTKGAPPAGQFYPGATAHIDTVHHDQAELADAKQLLIPKVEGDKITMWRKGKKYKAVQKTIDAPEGPGAPDGKIHTFEMEEEETLVQTGTGSDDKNAVAIVLSIMERTPFMKAALFVGEETNMTGSKAADMSFFDDVSWVFGCDSPGPASRMTKSLMGVNIYGKEFGEKWLAPICKRHGVTDARSESYTDISQIREKTKLDCCNVNNGGYNAHQPTEYALYSEALATEELGLDLVKSIPLDVRHTSEPERETPSWSYGGGGSYSDWWSRAYGGGSWRTTYGGGSGEGLGKWGRRTSASESPWLPGMGPKSGKTATMSWRFSSKGKANTYFLKMKRRLPWCRLRVEDAEAVVAGPYEDMKTAFIEAYNVDNEVNRPVSNVDANPALAREFARHVKVDEPARKKPAKKAATAKRGGKADRDEDDTCAVCLDLQSESNVDEFVDMVGDGALDVRVTVEDDPDGYFVTVTGRLKDVKQAYAAFYSIANDDEKITGFSDVEADGGAGEFWDCVEFAEQDETQDETVPAADAGEIEDADYVMKDDSAFGDDLMKESEDW